MKKLILTASLMLTAGVAFGQGTLVMLNSAATAVRDSRTGTNWVAGSASQVAIYGLAVFNQAEGSLVLQTGAITNIFTPGRFSGGQRTLSIPDGPATVQVRAWSGVFPNYEAAELAALGGDPAVVLGRSVLMNITLTSGASPPPTLLGNGLNQITVSPVPEPSSIALGLLGLGAIVLFRRRK